MVPWTHLPMVCAPFAEFTWRHARRLAAEKGLDDTSATELARVLDGLLTPAQAGPVDKATSRVAARARAATAGHRLPPGEEPTPMNSDNDGGVGSDGGQPAPVVPFGVFDADAEASRG
jgi:putative transposase